MQLNIKDPETNKLVEELVELTGESKTEAIRKAVRERVMLEKQSRGRNLRRDERKRKREFERTMAKIRKIQAEAKKYLKPSDFLTDDDIYDEYGLPK